jgi:hypothetical protein
VAAFSSIQNNKEQTNKQRCQHQISQEDGAVELDFAAAGCWEGEEDGGAVGDKDGKGYLGLAVVGLKEG